MERTSAARLEHISAEWNLFPVHPSTPSNRTTTSKTFKVLTCERLQKLVNAIAFFTAVELGTRIKLDILSTHLMTAAKCLLGAGAQIPSLSIRQRTTAPAATLRLIFFGRSWLKVGLTAHRSR